MAVTRSTHLDTAQIKGQLFKELEKPTAFDWRVLCQEIPSNTKTESHGFVGAIPAPREMLGGREIKGLNSWEYNIQNKTYELTVIIDRETLEDDQTGHLRQRISEIAESFNNYYPYLVASMLANGGVAGNVAFDGITYFNSTRVIGSSANIDNVATAVAAAVNYVPTAAEARTAFIAARGHLINFQNDQGQLANGAAMSKLAIICPACMEAGFRELVSAQIISSTSNVWGNSIADLIVCPWLTIADSDDDTWYLAALGSSKKPLVFQERTKLEVVTYDSPQWMSDYDGLRIDLRHRFRFAYGDPLKCVQASFS